MGIDDEKSPEEMQRIVDAAALTDHAVKAQAELRRLVEQPTVPLAPTHAYFLGMINGVMRAHQSEVNGEVRFRNPAECLRKIEQIFEFMGRELLRQERLLKQGKQ